MTNAGKATAGKGRVIVVGNEKGGSGKSTSAMHLIVALLRRSHSVASIDLDARQATLSRYFENRQHYNEVHGTDLPLPEHFAVAREALETLGEAREEEKARLAALIVEKQQEFEYLVIDTPGTDSYLSRVAHSFADILITPMNDSFLDLDLLARVDGDSMEILAPSIYSETVWEQRKIRSSRDQGKIDWVVMRNRLSVNKGRNRQDIAGILETLSRRLHFRVAPGFSERDIFRDLYLKGLTLLDLRDTQIEFKLNLSHVAARQEIRALLETLGLEEGTGLNSPADEEALRAAG